MEEVKKSGIMVKQNIKGNFSEVKSVAKAGLIGMMVATMKETLLMDIYKVRVSKLEKINNYRNILFCRT